MPNLMVLRTLQRAFETLGLDALCEQMNDPREVWPISVDFLPPNNPVVLYGQRGLPFGERGQETCLYHRGSGWPILNMTDYGDRIPRIIQETLLRHLPAHYELGHRLLTDVPFGTDAPGLYQHYVRRLQEATGAPPSAVFVNERACTVEMSPTGGVLFREVPQG